jgi:hypothetical protein
MKPASKEKHDRIFQGELPNPDTFLEIPMIHVRIMNLWGYDIV